MNAGRHATTTWVIAVCLTAVMGLAKPAAAQSNPSKAQSATELYDAAQDLFDKRRHQEALVLFRQAYDASKSPHAHLMIGHCLVALGKTAEAYEEMAATMREAAGRAQSEPKYARARDTAATQLARLEPKIGKAIVFLGGEDAASVMLNGVALSSDRWGTPVAVEPGTVTVEATRADGKSTRREATIGPGETQKISLTFTDTQKPPAAQPGDAPLRKTGGGVRIAGFVVAGVGVVGMAGFGVAGWMAQSKFHTLETECGKARCTDMKYAAVIDSGKTMALLANIGLGVGIAGIAIGGTMIIFGGPSVTRQPKASLELSPRGAMLRYSGTF